MADGSHFHGCYIFSNVTKRNTTAAKTLAVVLLDPKSISTMSLTED